MKQSIVFLSFLCCGFLLNAQQTVADSLSTEFNKVKAAAVIDKNDKQVLQLLEMLYADVMQSDKGMISEQTLSEYKRIEADKQVPNWQIFYLFDQYQDYVTSTMETGKTIPDFQLASIGLLKDEVLLIYEQIPAVVLIYMGETLIVSGMEQRAKAHFELSLQFYPESVPINVYNYLLCDNSEEKAKLGKKLKKLHPNHWMVQQFLG